MLTNRHNIIAILLYIAVPLCFAETVNHSTQFIVKENQVIIVPESIGDSFEEANKTFHYDWTQYASIEANKKKAFQVEAFLNKHNNIAKLPEKSKHQAGELFYKLGTYYISTGRMDLAIPALHTADTLLKDPANKAKIYNQLAFAHERNYATSKDPVEMAQSLDYSNKVIHAIYPDTKNVAVAFAYTIQGLVQNNAGLMNLAETNFKQAVEIYDSLPDNNHELIARCRNKYAAILLTKSGRENEAIAQLEKAKTFWMTQDNLYLTPYAARNFITLSKAYLKTNNPEDACQEANRALPIYKSFYGVNHAELAKPYRILAICHATLGNIKLAVIYREKLIELQKLNH